MAHKQKLREDKKKLEEAKTRASQKGPMGESSIISKCVYVQDYIDYYRSQN